MQIKMGGGGRTVRLMAACWREWATFDDERWSRRATGAPLADDLFAPPAGYKLNQRK